MKVRIPPITMSLILCIYLVGIAHNLAAQILGKRKSPGADAFAKQESHNRPKSSFKVDVNLVVVRASVTDRQKRCVMGLSREHFRIFEDKIEQSIVHFAAEDAPIGQFLFGADIIENLVNLTGGLAFFVSSFSALDYYVGLIYAELRNQYIIGYHSTNKAQDGKWRKIKVKLNAPGEMPKLAVRARAGYYAPKN